MAFSKDVFDLLLHAYMIIYSPDINDMKSERLTHVADSLRSGGPGISRDI